MEGNILHTKSSYAEDNIQFEPQRNKSNLDRSIKKLQESEQRLYDEFGKKDYKEFITYLREKVFADEILEIFSHFEPEYLENQLKKFMGDFGIYEEKIDIILNLENIEAKGYKLRQLTEEKITKDGNIVIGKITGLETLPRIFCQFNDTATLKKLLNKLFKDRTFDPTSGETKFVNQLLLDLLTPRNPNDPNSAGIKIVINGTTDIKEKDFAKIDGITGSPIKNFPWGLYKKQFDNYVEDSKKGDYGGLQEVQRAINKIKDFIINELGRTSNGESPQPLKDAIRETLLGRPGFQDDGFSDKANSEKNLALFFKGSGEKNFGSGVQGALGEFQAALIFNYLRKIMTNPSSKWAKIVGDTYDEKNRSEKRKTDVEIMEGLGLQVKNYTVIANNRFAHDIETNLHPDKVAKLINAGASFLQYVANYIFNTSYQQATEKTYQKLLTMLGDYLGEVMNLAVNDENDDSIAFYLISGRYLVPASVLLETADILQLKKNISIVSKSYKGYSDEEYKSIKKEKTITVVVTTKDGEKKKKQIKRKVGLLANYWKKKNGEWEPTDHNKAFFNTLISSNIRIQTYFNYWKEIENYAIRSTR